MEKIFSHPKSLREVLTHYCPGCGHGIVHRLDRQTSGVLLVAKTVEAYGSIKAQFVARKIEKEYLALISS